MSASLVLPGAIAELFAYAIQSGQLTQADRHAIAAALLSDDVTEEERASIDRLLRAIKRRRIVVTDELSAIR